MNDETQTAGTLGSTEGLGPLVEVLAAWEDQNGVMCAILPSEWDALKQDVMDACVLQSPRMLRNELLRLRAIIACARHCAKTGVGGCVEIDSHDSPLHGPCTPENCKFVGLRA